MTLDFSFGPIDNATWSAFQDRVAKRPDAENWPAILLYPAAPEVTLEDVEEELAAIHKAGWPEPLSADGDIRKSQHSFACRLMTLEKGGVGTYCDEVGDCFDTPQGLGGHIAQTGHKPKKRVGGTKREKRTAPPTPEVSEHIKGLQQELDSLQRLYIERGWTDPEQVPSSDWEEYREADDRAGAIIESLRQLKVGIGTRLKDAKAILNYSKVVAEGGFDVDVYAALARDNMRRKLRAVYKRDEIEELDIGSLESSCEVPGEDYHRAIGSWAGAADRPATWPLWVWAAAKYENDNVPEELLQRAKNEDLPEDFGAEFELAARTTQELVRQVDPTYDPETDTVMLYRGMHDTDKTISGVFGIAQELRKEESQLGTIRSSIAEMEARQAQLTERPIESLEDWERDRVLEELDRLRNNLSYYRTNEEGYELRIARLKQREAESADVAVEIEHRTIESWSADPRIASDFGTVILAARVPVSSVVAVNYGTKKLMDGEREYIVATPLGKAIYGKDDFLFGNDYKKHTDKVEQIWTDKAKKIYGGTTLEDLQQDLAAARKALNEKKRLLQLPPEEMIAAYLRAEMGDDSPHRIQEVVEEVLTKFRTLTPQEQQRELHLVSQNLMDLLAPHELEVQQLEEEIASLEAADAEKEG